VFAGLSYMLMHIFNVGVGMTFSGGVIDLTLFGILQGNDKTNWIWVPIVGIFYFAVYYLLFYFLIKARNYTTPGRETAGETKLYTRADYNEKKAGGTHTAGSGGIPERITEGLGGRENIQSLDACATRLRVTVRSPELVDEAILRETGAAGVIRKGGGVQIIYGPTVTVIKSELDEYLGSE
ncbi:MAG: PTS glucose transporter subunit IIA, partial [Ruminococcaceae bacterium]|nr:PTS glucose transporter subunit IIA [Oscillospiraceae bacterium]